MKTIVVRSGALLACIWLLSPAYASEAVLEGVAKLPATSRQESAALETARNDIFKLIDAFVDQHKAKTQARDKAFVDDCRAHVTHLEAICADPRSTTSQKLRAAYELKFYAIEEQKISTPATQNYEAHDETKIALDVLRDLLINSIKDLAVGTEPHLRFYDCLQQMPSPSELDEEKKTLLHNIEKASTEYLKGDAAVCFYHFDRLVLNYPEDKSRLLAYWLYHTRFQLEHIRDRLAYGSTGYSTYSAAASGPRMMLHNLVRLDEVFRTIFLANTTMLSQAIPKNGIMSPESERKCFLVNRLNKSNCESAEEEAGLALEWFNLEKDTFVSRGH